MAKQKYISPSNENLNRSVEELELSVRSYNCLKNANIQTIGELIQKSEPEMLRTRNFGRKSLNEIKEILGTMGLSLGMKFEDLAERLLSVKEAAERLGLQPGTLRDWIYRRKIPFVRVGRAVRIKESTVLEIIQRGTVPARESDLEKTIAQLQI